VTVTLVVNIKKVAIPKSMVDLDKEFEGLHKPPPSAAELLMAYATGELKASIDYAAVVKAYQALGKKSKKPFSERLKGSDYELD
jgi:hypothetical protein